MVRGFRHAVVAACLVAPTVAGVSESWSAAAGRATASSGAAPAPGARPSTAGPPPAAHGPRMPSEPGSGASKGPTSQWSTNWAGYALTGSGFSSVSGQWQVPQVSTPTKPKSVYDSSDWVGIDGDNDSDLIQAGTEQGWYHDAAFYRAWWEILPANETVISSVPVHPGDTMSVSISEGDPDWTITLQDLTSGQSFTTSQPYAGPLTSAEWIHERPDLEGKTTKLAPDSTVDFTGVTADGTNPDLVASEGIVMAKGYNAKTGTFKGVLAVPSEPDATANGFAVATGTAMPPPPS